MIEDTALESIRLLPKQIEQAWKETSTLKIGREYQNQPLIAVSGMGASIYSYYFLKNVFKSSLNKPLVKINNYGLPRALKNGALFIASSYSGTTEEVIFNLKQGIKLSLKCLVNSAGGSLVEIAKEHNLPFYQFSPQFNPSGQPRMGQGYMLFGTLGLLANLGYLDETVDLHFLKNLEEQSGTLQTQAKEIVSNCQKAELFYVAADHLIANAHILRNQTNETAKLFANYSAIPELNHHLMEGLKHPKNCNRIFIFLKSALYQKRNQQRLELTKEVIEKNGFRVIEYLVKGESILEQFVSTLIWGGYLTYELGLYYQENPNLIPWVDYFKNKLPKA